MKLLLNSSLFLILGSSVLFGENIEYKSGDIHTLTQKPNTLSIDLSYSVLNDTVDLLDFKSKEFDSATASAIGDMNGYEAKITYGIDESLMVRYGIGRQTFEYSGNTITNTNNELFLRKNIWQEGEKNFSGVSFDLGVVYNQLGDYYVSDIGDINELAKRYDKERSYKLEYISGGLFATSANSTPPQLLYHPWVGMEDTNDMSWYLRVISGWAGSHGMVDLFGGMKQTTIKNRIVASNELARVARSKGIEIEKELGRSERNYFAGVSGRYEWDMMGIEYLYQYDRFQRDSGLDYVNYNHTVELTLDWKVVKDILFYIGGKAMYRQLNGTIPYLYNEYTQTTYDHKYGYAQTGLLFRF